MAFNSATYLLFLAIVFALYWAMPQRRAQNWLLLIASMVFYGWWDAKPLLLIALSATLTYATGLGIELCGSNESRRRLLCAANIVVELGILCTFKYFNFFSESLCQLLSLFGVKASPLATGLILPVGVSFYTFQAISYTIDVYRRDIRASHDYIAFCCYICFFPQLVAGPIERAGRLLPVFNASRQFSYAQAAEGMRRILLGLFKKAVIADNCAASADAVFTSWAGQSSVALVWGALMFTIQIYCDFSGYCDIAVGSARLLGFRLSENFHNPYMAAGIRDFWRRWHMTLMQWFRDYIYIPLGGSRCSQAKHIRNIAVVFLLSGLWHGAGWTFVVWGLYNALLFIPFSVVDRLRTGVWAKRLLTFISVMVGWIVFRCADLGSACGYIGRMFTAQSALSLPPGISRGAIGLAAAALLFAGEAMTQRASSPTILASRMPCTARRCCYVAMALAVFALGGDQHTFIYFQF